MNTQLIKWSEITGRSLQASDGEIGTIKDIFFDDETYAVRYFVVRTGPWLIGRETLITPNAILDFSPNADEIPVSLTKDEVKNAPPYDSDRPVSAQFEQEYFHYYGYAPYWSGALVGPEIAPATTIPPQAPQPPVVEHMEALRGDPHLRSCREIRNYTVSAKGDNVGYIEDFVFEAGTWKLRHMLVETSLWPGAEKYLLPCEIITSIEVATETVEAPLTKRDIEVTPRLSSSDDIDREYEDDLYSQLKVEPYWQKADGRFHSRSGGLSPSQPTKN